MPIRRQHVSAMPREPLVEDELAAGQIFQPRSELGIGLQCTGVTRSDAHI